MNDRSIVPIIHHHTSYMVRKISIKESKINDEIIDDGDGYLGGGRVG